MVLSRTILFWSRRALAAEDGPVRSVLGSAGFDVEYVKKSMEDPGVTQDAPVASGRPA
jgi:hypothetical protein